MITIKEIKKLTPSWGKKDLTVATFTFNIKSSNVFKILGKDINIEEVYVTESVDAEKRQIIFCFSEKTYFTKKFRPHWKNKDIATLKAFIVNVKPSMVFEILGRDINLSEVYVKEIADLEDKKIILEFV